MSKKIKLMADYGCDPLWGVETDEIGDIDPTTLPISEITIKRLEKWVQTYEESLNWGDPDDSNSPEEKELKDFEQEGINLWLKLRQELSPNYQVIYYSQLRQKVINHPSEIGIFALENEKKLVSAPY